MNIFKRELKKPQFIIEHENRIANYAKKVIEVQELIYEQGLISSGSLYMLITYHYWVAFSSYYTKLRATSPLEMISFEEAVKKYIDIHTKRINNISTNLMEQYENKPVSAEANGYLKILLQELTEQAMMSLDDDSDGTMDILTLLK